MLLNDGHAPVSIPKHIWESGRVASAACCCVCFVRSLSESRMLEIGTSDLMSGEEKRVDSSYHASPRLYSGWGAGAEDLVNSFLLFLFAANPLHLAELRECAFEGPVGGIDVAL